MTERAEVILSGPCAGIMISQNGNMVTIQDLYRRQEIQRLEYGDSKAAFAALCCWRQELYLQFGDQE